MADPIETLRVKLVEQVRGVFNDSSQGQKPVPPSDNALYEKDTPIRLVHADLVGMMTGGIRGLLLQMLHPHALQGVLDHSNFRADMHGRLRRTARFIAVTTFGDRDAAMQAIDRVNRIHAKVGGELPDGTRYEATNPRTLAWVHVVEAQSFLAGYMRHVRPGMPRAEQ
ncbi:MAG: oxygenase MpaB family protein, partial [Erythrobacter sp.]